MARRGAGLVPERWTDYTPLGHRLPGTRFVAFKVPLAKRFNSNLLPEERFSPQDLLRKVRERKEELGLIIDLTYTTRYYGRQDLPPTLLYSKILTMGHEIPSRKIILRFHNLVRRFLTDNRDNDKLIGVHCTHGLNRTGYLVCRYLIDVEGMEPNAAIDLFNKSRGHPMERANYIRDLQRGALSTCELKDLDVPRKEEQQQLVQSPRPPLAGPREPGSAKEKQRPEGQRQGLEQLEQKQLEQKQLEQKQLEQRQQNHPEQNYLERRQKKKQKKLELRQKKKQKKLELREQNHPEQRQQGFLGQNFLEQNHSEQNFLEQRPRKKKRKKKKLEQRQQNHLEQRQRNFLEQDFLEQRQKKKQNYLEQRQQNHPEQRQQDFLGQNSLEPCPARKRWCWRRKPKVGQQKMS